MRNCLMTDKSYIEYVFCVKLNVAIYYIFIPKNSLKKEEKLINSFREHFNRFYCNTYQSQFILVALNLFLFEKFVFECF